MTLELALRLAFVVGFWLSILAVAILCFSVDFYKNKYDRPLAYLFVTTVLALSLHDAQIWDTQPTYWYLDTLLLVALRMVQNAIAMFMLLGAVVLLHPLYLYVFKRW